jgi:hypothetical protein
MFEKYSDMRSPKEIAILFFPIGFYPQRGFTYSFLMRQPCKKISFKSGDLILYTLFCFVICSEICILCYLICSVICSRIYILCYLF